MIITTSNNVTEEDVCFESVFVRTWIKYLGGQWDKEVGFANQGATAVVVCSSGRLVQNSTADMTKG